MIPAPVRERLAIDTAEYNNCTYCLSAHTCIGAHVAEVDAEDLERARHAESAGPHAAALPALSDARGRGHIGETQLKAARPRASLTPRSPRSWAIRRNNLTNHFNVLADTDNEWPVVSPHTHG
jgi:AhpD family alkylhydroperoxidase